MKCAKVIVFYFGERRTGSNNLNTVDILDDIVNLETSLDKGFDTDTFIVVNSSDKVTDSIVDKYDNLPTKNGKLRVFKRQNTGMSFGGYLDTFNQFKREYDYWFFVEDDVILHKPKYVMEFINELNSTSANFIALSPISNYHHPHCGGGCGLTSTAEMEKIYPNEVIVDILNNWDQYRGYDVASGKLNGNNAEIMFTREFRLANHHKFSPLCDNYKTHTSQRKFINDVNLSKEFIYSVGTI